MTGTYDPDEDPADSYRRAGLSEEEIRAVADVAAEVGSADPFAGSVAVPLGAVRTVLAVVDRFTDRATSAINGEAEE